jgi:SagB-type dehydrogenase family enzyme
MEQRAADNAGDGAFPLRRRELLGLLGLGLIIMRHDVSARSAVPVALPRPRLDGELAVEKALLRRRSIREYAGGALTLGEVSQLLWAAQGITHALGYRTAPSAGALYPLEVYLVVGNVAELHPGVYRDDPRTHTLSAVAAGDQRPALSAAALDQTCVAEAATALVFCVVYHRVTVKYGERGVRYAHMEIGHAAQNVYLQAQSLRLGTVVVGAFQDDRVKKVIGADSNEQPLCIMPIGRR